LGNRFLHQRWDRYFPAGIIIGIFAGIAAPR
jgi:hypothetical protein